MTIAQPTPRAIRQQYWGIATGEQPGYVRVRALDSLSRLLDLFPRPKRPGYFAAPPEPVPPANEHYAVASLKDDDLDVYIVAKDEAEAKAKAKAEAKAKAKAKAKARYNAELKAKLLADQDDDEDDDDPNPDEDEPP